MGDVQAQRTAASLRAHAKLTLTLKMTGVRSDGYHLIDAEMVSLDLHDVITFDPRGSGITAIGPFSAGVPTDQTNLVAGALRLSESEAHVTIDKRIPHGGGLGGGSTDAATTLRWAGYPVDAHFAGACGPTRRRHQLLSGRRARSGDRHRRSDPTARTRRPHGHARHSAVRPSARLLRIAPGTTSEDRPSTAPTTSSRQRSPSSPAWHGGAMRSATGREPLRHSPEAVPRGSRRARHSDALADLVDEGATVVVAHTVPSEVATNQTH